MTPQAIAYLNKLAAEQGDAPTLSPTAMRFLNSRLEGLAVLQKIVPAVLGLVIGGFMVMASLPTFAENVYEVFTTKAGRFTLENLTIQSPGWYTDTGQTFAMTLTGIAIIAFVVGLLVKSPRKI